MAERTAALSQAVDALHAEALEREQTEAALRRSQKMEAVGQLTGGIAHDFNNMLQAIGGSLELMRRRIGQGRIDEAGQFVDAARQMVKRAAALTNRLLAFARRQTLQPHAVKPDDLIEGMADLIRRTTGSGIAVELRMGDGIWTVLCDPNQLENVLLNLAINARDAMPEGGRLTIGTQDVSLSETDVAGQEEARPGDYVEISVADTGTGMDEATRTRAFEPFFTTKPLGQGTGLGLSQLYGFVRQSDGIVRLDSAPGQGTVVRLYLPRHEPVGSHDDGLVLEVEPQEASAGETVLLVEDQDGVRAVVAEHLREFGYTVLEAADGAAALRLLRLGARGRAGNRCRLAGRAERSAGGRRRARAPAGLAGAVHHGLRGRCAGSPARPGDGGDRQAIRAGRPRHPHSGHAGESSSQPTSGVGMRQGRRRPWRH